MNITYQLLTQKLIKAVRPSVAMVSDTEIECQVNPPVTSQYALGRENRICRMLELASHSKPLFSSPRPISNEYLEVCS